MDPTTAIAAIGVLGAAALCLVIAAIVIGRKGRGARRVQRRSITDTGDREFESPPPRLAQRLP
jgi:hypothetical protein